MKYIYFTLIIVMLPLLSFSQETKAQKEAKAKKEVELKKEEERKNYLNKLKQEEAQRNKDEQLEYERKNAWKENYSFIGEFLNGVAKVRHKNSDLYGFVDDNGEEVIQPIFQSIEDFNNGLAWAKLADESGFIDATGSKVSDFKKSWAYSQNDLCPIRINSKYGYINKSHTIIIKPQYQEADIFYNGLAKIKIDNKWGFINKDNQQIVPPIYDECGVFNDDGIALAKNNNYYIVIDNRGNIISDQDVYILNYISNNSTSKVYKVKIKGKNVLFDADGHFSSNKFDFIGEFNDGIAKVSIDKKFNFINSFGKTLSDNVFFDNAWDFSNGYALVKVGDNIGMIDKTGNYFIEPNNWGLKRVSDDLGKIQKGFQFIIFHNLTGKAISSKLFDEVGYLSCGLINVKYDGNWGYIDTIGKTIIDFQYSEARPFFEDRAIIGNSNGDFGVIDIKGVEILKPNLKYIGNFENGFAIFSTDYNRDNKGIINSQGNVVVKAGVYEDIKDYSNGLSRVKKYLYGYINEQGIIKLPLDYEEAGPFINGFAIIKKGKYKIIDKKGEVIKKLNYDDIYMFYYSENGIYPVNEEKKWGYINSSGEEIVPLKYEYAQSFNNGLAAVKLNGLLGFINETGSLVIDHKFYYTEGFKNGRASVYNSKELKNLGKYYIIDRSGKCIRDCENNK